MKASTLVLVLAVTAVAACGGSSSDNKDGDTCKVDTSYDPSIAPANFANPVSNPFFPLVPGTKFVYAGGGETDTVTVTDDSKLILGIKAKVVHDVVTEDGVVTEDTLDYYAEDNDGNVWYLGEDTKEYEAGRLVGTEGSWLAGVDGAKPGVIMYADPPLGGGLYRQEYLACEAEDMAEVVSESELVKVPYGRFDGALKTHEVTPLEPDADEAKYYVENVGLVLEVDATTGERNELISVTQP